MTEAYTNLENTMLYYGDGEREGAHFTFNFFLITDLNLKSTAQDIKKAIMKWMDNLPANHIPNWVVSKRYFK